MAGSSVRQSRQDTRLALQADRGNLVRKDLLGVNPITITGATDALPSYGTVYVNKAGVDAMTLATPVAGAVSAGGDDGKELIVISLTANAHTITTAANKINGNKAVATFGAAAYNFARFIAANGVWVLVSSTGITLS